MLFDCEKPPFRMNTNTPNSAVAPTNKSKGDDTSESVPLSAEVLLSVWSVVDSVVPAKRLKIANSNMNGDQSKSRNAVIGMPKATPIASLIESGFFSAFMVKRKPCSRPFR